MHELPPADAFDAFLVSGGLPLILDEWPVGATALDYVADAVTNPLSALLVSGERALAAEFPPESQARLVLGAIGSGERTYSKIQRAAGGIPQATLNRALRLLTAKRVVEVAVPPVGKAFPGNALHGRRPAPAVLARVPRPAPA
jgi:DNA-binding transcriptional ArsR family regulator